MKLKITKNPLFSTPSDIMKEVSSFMEEQKAYVERIRRRGRDAAAALDRLLPAVLARCERAGINIGDNRTKGAIRDYLGCLYFGTGTGRTKRYTFVHTSPPATTPVVTYNPDMEVGPLWYEAIEYLNQRGTQVDETMAQAIVDHRQLLLETEGVEAAEDYLKMVVQKVYVSMCEVDAPTFFDHNLVQESGRLNGADARGAGVVGSKWSRILFLTKPEKVKNKEYIYDKIRELHGVEDLGPWASKIIEEYDVSSFHKAEELHHALVWHDIETTGETRRMMELDAHTSGMTHLKLQTGHWRRKDIDSTKDGWVKLYTHVANRLKHNPWLSHREHGDLLAEAKKIMASSQYGGGPRAIATQYFKGLKYDHKAKQWVIPTNAVESIPQNYYELFETHTHEGQVLPMPVLDDLQDGLERFYEEILKSHYNAFLSAFRWIQELNDAIIEWSESHAGEVVQYPDGFQRRIHRFKTDDLGKKIRLNLYDSDGFKHPTGVFPLKDSSFTEGLAMETHHLDALQMIKIILEAKKDEVDIYPILDAACVNAADLEWLEEVSSRTFIEVHSEPRFPVGTKNFKPWTGDAPVVWGV
jgi:hypothetical protein